MPAALAVSPHASLSDLHILDDKPFVASPHFYVRQPHCLQIIQLVEAEAPPPPKAISSSSFASSSYYSSSYYSSSYYSESEAYSDDDEDEDQEMGSSYCSSEEQFDADEDSENNTKSVPGSIQSPETFSLRMKRILAWREHFDAASTLLVGESTLPSKSLKRKLDTMCEGDSIADNASHSSKRSRSSQISATGSVELDLKSLGISSPSTSVASLPSSTTTSSSLPSMPTSPLCMHSCTACDAFFDTPESLREHGTEARVKEVEACAVAVEYAFE